MISTARAVACAEPSCPNRIYVDLRHADNLQGRWLCPDHPKESDR